MSAKTPNLSLWLFFVCTTLAFASNPAQHQTVFIDRDAYQNIIHPPEYWGASALELIGEGAFNVNNPVVAIEDIVWADNNSDGFGNVPTNVSWELKEHSLLNRLVEDLASDPIALAAYVQNEISLTQGFQSVQGDTSGALQSATIVRGAYGTYLEKQGSPWEQCALLVYLLRRAGYPAAIVETGELAILMRADRLDRTLGLRLVETFGPNDTLPVNFPWVIVNEAKDGSGDWQHLFPWIKDVVFEEGFDPYRFFPDEYNTGEKWIDKYLQNDPAILSLVGPDGKDAPGELFPKFVQQHIANTALSLEDIGFQSYNRKLQYNEWSDFPKPFWIASLRSETIGGPINIIIKSNDLLQDDQFRFAGIRLRVVDQFNQVYLQTDILPLSQLTNRKLYFYRNGITNGATRSIGLRINQLDPQGTNLPIGSFNTSDIPAAQESTQVDFGYDLRLEFDLFNVFPNAGGRLIESRPLPLKGVSAIVINTGAVTNEMMDLLVREFDALQADGTPSENELLANAAFMTGQLYWKNSGRDAAELNRLHKIYNQGALGVCVASLRDNGAGFAHVPTVDIPTSSQVYANATIHPQRNPQTPSDALGKRDIALLDAANLSAHEHQVINQFYGVDNAISTVRLLQIANRDFASGSGLNPQGFYKFTRSEFNAANSDTNYAFLRAFAGIQWTEAREILEFDNPSYLEAGWERVYSTPFPITMDTGIGENATYSGMGLLTVSRSTIGATIANNLNGGFGPEIPGDPFAPENIDNLDLNFDENGDIALDDDGNPNHPSRDETADPQSDIERSESNERSSETPTNDQEALQNTQDNGDVGRPENNDTQDDVGDPVDPVTGKFVSDHVDLTLHGPFPLELRRNYSSFNVAHNLFGYGWKLNFMPYINVKTDDSAVFVADLDGSVVQYNRAPGSSPMRWEASTDAADNPYLDNNYMGAIGGQSNRYAAYIEKTTEGTDVVYTLYKPNGHEARYIVRSFPIDLGVGTVQRARPYLDTWEDALGNTMTFSYYETAGTPEYGQLRRIESSNGNFLGFLYNREREITESFANDGRRVYYRYDNRGDLREVTLPDNATIRYDYKLLTDSASGEVYSTHLIERITKPDGRVLENTYAPLYNPDNPEFNDVTLRRVVSQKATVGDTLDLIENAVYEYFAASDSGVANPTAQPWTQAGFDVTLVHSDVRPQLGRLTTIYVHQEGLKRYIADPLASNDFAPDNTDLDHVLTYEYYSENETGGYPRSLKRMRDKRGLETLYEYDPLGNLSKSTQRGDITGDGLPEDVHTYFFYDPVNYLPTKIIYPAETANGAARIVLNTYADTGPTKRANDPANPGFELYRFLPQKTTTYEVVAAPVDASVPSPTDEQATLTFLYDHEENLTAGTAAYGLLKSTRHQGADDADDKSRTDYTHNNRGFVTSTTEFTFTEDANVVTQFNYNARGELEEQIDNAGRVVRYDYDMLGRLTHTEKFNTATEILPAWWSYNHYNLNGELTWTDGPRYGVEDYIFRDYDGAGRVLAEVVWRSEAKPDGSGVQPVAEQDRFLGQAVTYYDYDAFGNLTSTIDPRGNETLFDYDALGRLIRKTHPTVGNLTAEETYTYEPGNLVTTRTNALGGVTTNHYTDHGALKQSDAPAVDGRSERWTYYLDGRTHTHTRSNGAVTTYTYNDAARSTTMETVKDSVTLEKTVEYFDTRGNKIRNDIFYQGDQFYTFNLEYDGLDRLSRSSGPPEQLRTQPVETASALQQTDFNYSYSLTGDRYTVTATTAGEKSIEVFDGIGRISRTEKRDSADSLHYQESFVYDTAHQFVTTFYGSSETDDRVKTIATNTFGQNILTLFADNTYTRRVYDKAGNLVETYDEATLADGSPRFAYSYDERNRLATETKLDGSVTTFAYDAENNLALRSMPGDIRHHQTFDAANRITEEYLEGDNDDRSREIDYNYYTTTEDIGLLQSRIENPGITDQITHSYIYDDLLRIDRYTCDGTNYTGFAHEYEYDLRSLVTTITRAPTSVATGQLSTRIVHEFDGYGQLLEERVFTGTGTVDGFVPTALHSHVRQSWDGLGRRNQFGLGSDATPLGSIAPSFDYTFYASNQLASITPGAFSDPWQVQYDYADNRLLSERRFRVNDSYNARQTQTLNRRLENATPYRDERGRIIRNMQTANGVPILDETLTWFDDSRLNGYTLARGVGNGTSWDDFTDSRNHTYDPDNRRLETESFLPEPRGSARTFNYDFDSDHLGVRTKAALDSPDNIAWETPDPDVTGLDAFKRIITETARPEERSFTVSGATTGPGIFELYLGASDSPSTFEFLQRIDPDNDYGDGDWQIPLSLKAGQYTLEARGAPIHPDSTYQATDSSTFTVTAPDPQTIDTTYDAHGRVKTRAWANGAVIQNFSWDASGHLLKIAQTDNSATKTVGSYLWTAQYDGLGRRIQTDYIPEGANAITIANNRVKTWHDPQVEFMSIAVEHHGKREWLVHGPDMDTNYGSFQGIGGLEAIVDEATGKTTPIVDTVHGHVIATIDLGDPDNAVDDKVHYKQQQFGGYGPLPGTQQKPLEVTEDLAASLGWQTRCIDPTSFFTMGARHYDPLSGRFLSADPLGHSATPDLYSYANGDPINFLDPTGRNIYAIDGTAFDVEKGKGGDYSNVHDFASRNDVSSGSVAVYYGGPGTQSDWKIVDTWNQATGLNTNNLADTVTARIMSDRDNEVGDRTVNIVGWSRGAVAAVQVAENLREAGIEVNFMGLYDAVEMVPNPSEILPGDQAFPDSIPDNVQNFSHAQRSSPWYFDGSLIPFPRSTYDSRNEQQFPLLNPTENYFWGLGPIDDRSTHGDIGTHPTNTGAHQFILDQAAQAGVPLTNTDATTTMDLVNGNNPKP